MRQLLPVPADVDPVLAHAEAHRPAPAGRPWLALNMVASVDGATALADRSGGLGGPADKEVFRAIRAVADVIVVAAGTVRAESYGPPRPSTAVQQARTARGQATHPRLVVLSTTLDLDPGLPLFAEAVEPPLVLTASSAAPERRRALAAVADVRVAGDDRVDVAAAARLLGELGARCAVVEGGPTLNGQFLAAGLLDEVNLTLAPLLVGGGSARVAAGGAEVPQHLDLAHLWEADGLLLARYVRVSGASAPSPS